MVIGMVMNPSAKFCLDGCPLAWGNSYGIESVVPIRMAMAGLIPATPVKAKVWQVLPVMRMHSSMTHTMARFNGDQFGDNKSGNMGDECPVKPEQV